jgi:hypothetical protein
MRSCELLNSPLKRPDAVIEDLLRITLQCNCVVDNSTCYVQHKDVVILLPNNPHDINAVMCPVCNV